MNNDRTVAAYPLSVDISLLIVRVIVGAVFIAHGAQKLFGAWGGKGLEATVAAPPDGMGPIGYLVAIGEFFGGIGLVVGLLTRFSAASIIVIMIGAIYLVHWQGGFFAPKGFEYNLALIGLLLPILICGPGRLSIGRYLPLPKSARTGRPLIALE